MGDSGLDQLIPVINKLQTVFTTANLKFELDLPQIVVIGSQSSGKSSVLENIVKKDFLPRGQGIVTRRPLVLQLVQMFEKSEWAEFMHIPNKKFTNFSEVRDEIQRETDRISGKNKGISSQSIGLTIFSHKVPNLTLVDLPGTTRNPVGDQPPDIERHIREMVLKFISRPNTIILAVSPANSDLANSEALNLAREVDPDGNRTLGLLTKLDIMDRGTDAMDVLTGRVIPLKLAYIGVVNRSQDDINKGKNVEKALEDEKKFFDTHKLYKTVANRCGTDYLSKRLNQILVNHIKNALPELKEKVKDLIADTQAELAKYGDAPLLESKTDQGAFVLDLLSKFSIEFKNSIDGTASDLRTSELFGGARISYIFNEWFTERLMNVDPCKDLRLTDIRTAIRNANGPKTALFIPELAFEILVKAQIKKLEIPSLQCCDQVYEELIRITHQIEKREEHFPVIREKFSEIASEYLLECLHPTNDMISNLVKIELAFINTNHPDFIGGQQAVQEVFERLNPSPQEMDQQMMLQQQQQQQQQRRKGGRDPPVRQQQQASQKQSMISTIFGKVKKQPTMSVPMNQASMGKIPSPLRLEGELSNTEYMQCELIKVLIRDYFEIVVKNITDSVPKAVMWGLVNRCKQNIQRVLVNRLYKEELFPELLEEGSDTAEKRAYNMRLLKALEKASEVLREIRQVRM